MLSHKSHLIVINDVRKRTNVQDGFRTILYLPLNNSFGRTITYVSQIAGMTAYYVNGIAKLQQSIAETKPNFMATAPLLLERIMMAALQTGESLTGEIKDKFEEAKQLIDNYEYSDSYYQTEEYKQAYELFFSKWKNFLGGEIVTLLAGGALVSKSIHNFFRALKMNVLSGYGLTETSGVISIDSIHKITKPGFCGQNITGMDIKISDEGEILAKGNNLMQEYYKHPKITAETIDKEGWIHTGDIGKLDEEGYLSIRGRLKSTFKLISGDYVYPETIEEKLKKHNQIANIVVAGLAKEYIIALIVPNIEAIKEWGNQNGINFETPEEITENKEIIKLFEDIFAKYNNILLDAKQRVEKFKLLSDQWSIETGEITPTMKIRRNYILEKYNNEIEELYK
jgi:long-chain acyl-CoA synthetase